MKRLHPPTPITAIVYSSGALLDGLLREIASHLKSQGIALAGFVQHSRPRTGRGRCDMLLEDLGSGARIGISEDRGPHARGCMLAIEQLIRASEVAARALDGAPDLLVINKFGKTEAEGGGFRALIGDALGRDIPILIAVPRNNVGKWHEFADRLAREHQFEDLAREPEMACRQLGLAPQRDFADARRQSAD